MILNFYICCCCCYILFSDFLREDAVLVLGAGCVIPQKRLARLIIGLIVVLFLFWSLSSPWYGPGRILGGPLIDAGKAGECQIVIKAITGTMVTMPIAQISSARTILAVGCDWWFFWSLLSPWDGPGRILGGPVIDIGKALVSGGQGIAPLASGV